MYKIYSIEKILCIGKYSIRISQRYVISNQCPAEEIRDIGWEELKEYADRSGDMYVINKKKGRVFLCYAYPSFTIREWKEPNIKIQYKTKIMEERKFTVKELLEKFSPSPELAAYIIQEFGLNNLRNIIPSTDP